VVKPAAGAGLGIALWVALATQGDAGHEFPFYPSYYPQEIQIEVVDPGAAAGRFKDGSLHAYLGGDPYGGAAPPPGVGTVDSLGGYVVVAPTPGSPAGRDAASRCRAARRIAARLRGRSPGPSAGQSGGQSGGWTFHPYAVTPYHADFLLHADLSLAARDAHDPPGAAESGPPLQVEPRNAAALRLFGPGRVPDGKAPDAAVEVVELADLIRPVAVRLNGWMGPRWLMAGWFHAYLLQAGGLTDPGARAQVEAASRRLMDGSSLPTLERTNLERALVTRLGEGCERVVVGYVTRREYLNADYSGGVENVGVDARTGLLSPIFPRTAKLKDFPWNGWLTVGVARELAGPWNPVAGFDDPGSRLAWAAVVDPAHFPAPRGPSWVSNRVTVSPQLAIGGRRPAIPSDAVAPEPGTGRLRKVGGGKDAAAQLRYRVLNSAFHDGTRMTVGDVLYAYAFAFRWGAPGSPGTDPAVERATAAIREHLAGLHVLRVETDVLAFGEDKLSYEVPVIDVYLRDGPTDPIEAGQMAPPWTALPWHLLVLMEEAVARGLAAFSAEPARTRAVPVIDLVRDGPLRDALDRILDDLARRRHVPDALKDYATPDEARERYTALKAFRAKHGHLLVTNGPYQLTRWSAPAATLTVFRDLSYPRGLGTFNALVTPLRAYVTSTARRGDRLEVGADVEKVERYGREMKIVREPFSKKASESDKRSLPLCHYLVIGPDRTVVKAGTVAPSDPGVFIVEPVPPDARPGPYTVLIALSLDGNHVDPPVTTIPWTR
jgi:hypothetical protein